MINKVVQGLTSNSLKGIYSSQLLYAFAEDAGDSANDMRARGGATNEKK